MSLHPSAGAHSSTPSKDAPGAFPPSPRANSPSTVVSAPQSLSQAVKARKDEYIRKQEVRIKVGSWNVASVSGTEKDLGSWFVDGLGVKGLSENLAGLAVESSTDLTEGTQIESVADQEEQYRKKKSTIPRNDVPAVPGGSEIGLYVLGLQEVVDIASATEALRPYTDPNPGKKWKQAMQASLPEGYVKVAEQQLLGLLILIYASPKIAPIISNVSSTSVGTGLMGYLGNKGATSVRLVLGETTKLIFVNSHLAAGADKNALSRRIWDTNQITSRTRFAPITENEVTQEFGDGIGDEDFAFWFGDLNYRLDDIPGDDVRRLLLLHTRNEYDVQNKSKRKIDSELGFINAPSSESLPNDDDDPPLDPHSDPASLHTTIQSLFKHDQLRGQQKSRKAFHEGWQEGDINFLPTYKYDIGSVGMFDSGEKKRSPSWCDRILYRSRKHRLMYEQQIREEEAARKKDADMKARGIDQAASDNAVLFDYDPDEDGLAYGDEYDDAEENQHDAELIETYDETEDSIVLDHYISHQRVLSSDHKPLDAIFTLTYNAVIPDLKARVHQEVARELDKAENEGRPSVTVVVDNQPSEPIGALADTSADRIDLSGVDFGPVYYEWTRARSLTIANTGQSFATFCFIDRPASELQKGGVTPAWLHLEVDRPSKNANHNVSALREYSLPPGETANVSLTVNISHFELAHQLNISKVVLDDILVLRIVNGRDHFIPVRGMWMQTCFCRTLDELVRIPEGGIRFVQKRTPQVLINNEAVASEDDGVLGDYPVRHSAPRELFALTEGIQDLAERSIAEWEMTNGDEQPPWRREPGGLSWPFDAQTWTLKDSPDRSALLANARESLDTASPVQEKITAETSCLIRLEILASTLLGFLKSLRDGVISSNLWTEIEASLVTSEKTKTSMSDGDVQELIMETMSTAPVHSVSLTFISFMLSRIVNELAPKTVESTSPTSPRAPRTSMSSDGSGQSHADITGSPFTPSSPQNTSLARASFLPSLRRRRTDTRSSTVTEAAQTDDPAKSRREDIQRAYAEVFASVLIRSEKDGHVKGKEKRLLESRKKKVVEVLLSA